MLFLFYSERYLKFIFLSQGSVYHWDFMLHWGVICRSINIGEVGIVDQQVDYLGIEVTT